MAGSLHQAIARGDITGAGEKEHHHQRNEDQIQHASIIEADVVRKRSRLHKEFVKTRDRSGVALG
jgi:hypothetical protein